jgi:3'(2'), 5'-bisphosphate nucleotidase
MAGSVSLRALTSACVDLAAGAGELIRAVAGPDRAPTSLELVSKSDDTPQTVADWHAQRHIISGLRAAHSSFAQIAIVGEEGGEEADGKWTGAPVASLTAIDDAWPADADVVVPAADIAVFVDPLDGTKEFTSGRYEYVTTLVGITVRGEPAIGIISQPYALRGRGRVLWGGRAAGGVHEYLPAAAGGDAIHSRLRPPADEHAARHAAMVSLSREAGPVDMALTQLEALGLVKQRLPAGGAGFKSMCVVDGRAGYYLFPRAGTSRWDTCAPQALIEAVGGVLLDRMGRRMVYDACAADHGNEHGIVACRQASNVELVIKITRSDLSASGSGA